MLKLMFRASGLIAINIYKKKIFSARFNLEKFNLGHWVFARGFCINFDFDWYRFLHTSPKTALGRCIVIGVSE